MGASLALAGVSGCAFQPPETIVPYVEQPEQIVTGKPLFFATALTMGGYATGVLVESQWAGRRRSRGTPTTRPASAGPTSSCRRDPRPVRPRPLAGRHPQRPGQHLGRLPRRRSPDPRRPQGQQGAGAPAADRDRTSPTLVAQIRGLLAERIPEAKWHQYDPVGRDNARAGAELAFGEDVQPVHHLDQADVIVALDADFLPGARLGSAMPATSPPARAERRPERDEPALRRRAARRRSPARSPTTASPCRGESASSRHREGARRRAVAGSRRRRRPRSESAWFAAPSRPT